VLREGGRRWRAWIRDAPPAPQVGARWWFLRGLGLIYLAAFVSLWVQVDGLIGSGGILPAADYLRSAHDALGGGAYRLLPTLLWLHPSDAALHALCAGGALAALLLTVGIVPLAGAAAAWVFYLSLTVAGQTFLSFQWDNLLLETGLLAAFAAPAGWRPGWATDSPPSRLTVFLFRGLLFKLMFLSGVVKLASGDTLWRSLRALTVHYQTQPLPPWTAWYAFHLPAWFHVASAALMFAVELGCPWLVFLGRPLRRVAFAALVGLQALILVTGNYCFFNFLAIALCLWLVDDAMLPRRLRPPVREGPARGSRIRFAVTLPLAALVVILGADQMAGGFRRGWAEPGWVAAVDRAAAPFRSINGYGLFAVMTPTRPEIVVEGSRDGVTWVPYAFRWKPGALDRRPRFVAPHQPRLDWQMWFAALGTYRGNRWFGAFLARLLEGSPEVLGLLADDPFPGAPPRYIRATLYDYRFTTAVERRDTGNWWRREELGPYTQVVSLSRGPSP